MYEVSRDLFLAKVEKTPTCWLWLGCTVTGGYGGAYLHGRKWRAHRLAYELYIGPIGKGLDADHLCYNPICVNPDHLQLVTHQQNQENRSGAQKTSRSGIRGVGWHAGRWRAYAKKNGRLYDGGRFKTIEEAETAAIALRNQLMTNNLADRSR